MTREEAIRVLKRYRKVLDDYGDMWLDERDIPLLEMAIESLSAEPIVRCKDCKWYKKIVEKSKSGVCHYDLVARCLHDEDYCSHGERRKQCD